MSSVWWPDYCDQSPLTSDVPGRGAEVAGGAGRHVLLEGGRPLLLGLLDHQLVLGLVLVLHVLVVVVGLRVHNIIACRHLSSLHVR